MRLRCGWIVLTTFMALGCTDKAQPQYAECLKEEAKGDPQVAAIFCRLAIEVDPTSSSGKAAAAKLKEMQPAIEAAEKAEAKAAEERRKAEEAAKKAAEEARLARVQQIRGKIKRKYWAAEPDRECTGRGMPPYRWTYEGGTFAEDAEVAYADGCQKPHSSPEITDFCCPKGPSQLTLQLNSLGY